LLRWAGFGFRFCADGDVFLLKIYLTPAKETNLVAAHPGLKSDPNERLDES